MGTATVIDAKVYDNNNRIRWYELDSVEPSQSSGEIKLPIPIMSGDIKFVKVSCNSTNYDFFITDKTGEVKYSIHQIYGRDSCNRGFGEAGIRGAAFCSDDEFLYMTLTNNDLSNATGDIHVELMIGG